jgi:glycosyltransferase involved in cell wall biosynthesis
MTVVGLLGNENNMLFATARHLRDRGIDARLFLYNTDAGHFHPSCDTFELDYRDWTTQLAWGRASEFSNVSAATIERDTRHLDRIIASGAGPGYLSKIGRPVDVFIPYGSDIDEMPFRPPEFNRRSLRSLYEFPKAQRRGIEMSKHLVGPKTEMLIERNLRKLDFRGKRHMVAPPMVYTPLYNPESIAKYTGECHWLRFVQELRARVDVLVFHHARHLWVSPARSYWSKGNDILVRGFAEACKQRPSTRFGLVLVEYGGDVEATKELIRDLGVEKQVLWLPSCLRKDLMVGMSLADIGSGQFGESYLTSGVVNETLAMAKPLLSHRIDRDYLSEYGDLYPMLHSPNPQAVTAHLTAYSDRSEEISRMGQQGMEWHQKRCIDEPVDLLVKLLQA